MCFMAWLSASVLIVVNLQRHLGQRDLGASCQYRKVPQYVSEFLDDGRLITGVGIGIALLFL